MMHLEQTSGIITYLDVLAQVISVPRVNDVKIVVSSPP